MKDQFECHIGDEVAVKLPATMRNNGLQNMILHTARYNDGSFAVVVGFEWVDSKDGTPKSYRQVADVKFMPMPTLGRHEINASHT